MLNITNVTKEGKTREVPNEAYYFEEMLAKMNEIINGQENIRQMLAGMSAVTGMFGIAQASADVSKGINEISQSISEMSGAVQDYCKVPATSVTPGTPVASAKETEKTIKEAIKAVKAVEETPKTPKEDLPVPKAKVAPQEATPKEVIPKEVIPKEVIPKETTPQEDTAQETAPQEDLPELASYQLAADFMLDALANGERLAVDVTRELQEKGFTRNVISHAKRVLYEQGKIISRGSKRKSYLRLTGTDPNDKNHFNVTQAEGVRRGVVVELMGEHAEEFREYDRKASHFAKQIVANTEYKTVASVYSAVFDTMTTQYGFCWAQMGKEAKRNYHLNRAPAKMELCYCDKSGRTIFMSKLEDWAYNLANPDYYEKTLASSASAPKRKLTLGEIISEQSKSEMDKAILEQPQIPVKNLIKQYMSKHHILKKNYSMVANEVYCQMTRMGVDWTEERKKYANRNHGSGQTDKNHLVEADGELYQVFCLALNALDKAAA